MASRQKPAVVQEGPEAASRFERTMDRLLSVSKEELAKREAEYQDAQQDKPRRGPKPSVK